MIINFSQLTSDLINQETLVYISKVLEYQYAVDFQHDIENELVKIINEVEEKAKNEFARREIDIIDFIPDLTILRESINNIKKEILNEAYVEVEDINTHNVLQPTTINFKVGKDKTSLIEIPVGIKCVNFVLKDISSLYNKILNQYYTTNEDHFDENKYSRYTKIFFKYLRRKLLKLTSSIFAKKFLKKVRNFWLWMFKGKFNENELNALKTVLFDNDNTGILLSINDIAEMNVLESHNTAKILKIFKQEGWDFFTVDDPTAKKVYIWNLNNSVTSFYAITYDMMYSSILKRTAEDMERIKKANRNLFSIRRPNKYFEKILKG